MKKQILCFPVLFTLLICGVMAVLFLSGRGTVEERPLSPSESGSTWTEPRYPININTATEAELTHLPGIGSALAERITAYRQEHGLFSEPAELANVSGIGSALLDELLPYITTGG